MKRPIKLLIAAGILAVVLVSYFIVARMNADKDGTDGETDSTVTLASPDTDSLTEISYTYQGNTVTLAKDDTGSWYYTEDRNFPLNGTRIDAMLTALSSVTATRQVSEKSDDFSEFGLAEPQCSITAKTKDGTAYVFHIGSYNEMLNSYYINVGGTEKAYLTGTSLPESFFYKLLDLIKIDSFDAISSDAVTSLSIRSAADTLRLTYFEDGTASYYTASQQWFLTDGETLTAADGTAVSSLLSTVSTLSYAGCAAYGVSEADLGKYGLDNPAYTLTVNYRDTGEDGEEQEKTFLLRIGGKTEEGGYYVMRDGADMVCTMTSTTLSGIVNASRTDLTSDTVFAMSLDSVKEAVIQTAAGSVTVSVSDESEHASFTEFFNALGALTAEGKESGTPAGAPVLQVKFTRNTETFSDMTFALYEHNSDFYRVVFNGRSDLLIGKRAAESLIALAEAAN